MNILVIVSFTVCLSWISLFIAWPLPYNFTQNIQVRQQLRWLDLLWRWACNLWFCSAHNMGGLATLYTNDQHTNRISRANHWLSRHRNQAQKLEEKQASSCREIEAHQTDNGGWVRTTRFTHLDHHEWSETSLAYIRRHVRSAWQPASQQQMALHMRDHASSLLFSREEPLFPISFRFDTLRVGHDYYSIHASWNSRTEKYIMPWLIMRGRLNDSGAPNKETGGHRSWNLYAVRKGKDRRERKRERKKGEKERRAREREIEKGKNEPWAQVIKGKTDKGTGGNDNEWIKKQRLFTKTTMSHFVHPYSSSLVQDSSGSRVVQWRNVKVTRGEDRQQTNKTQVISANRNIKIFSSRFNDDVDAVCQNVLRLLSFWDQ